MEVHKRIESFGRSWEEEMACATSAPLLGQLPMEPGLSKLCEEGNIEGYDGEIVTRLGESLIQAVSAEVK